MTMTTDRGGGGGRVMIEAGALSVLGELMDEGVAVPEPAKLAAGLSCSIDGLVEGSSWTSMSVKT